VAGAAVRRGSAVAHGKRRTNADKRKAVMTLLEDGEWSQWSNAEIGRRCAVDEKTAAKYRKEIAPPDSGNSVVSEQRTYTTKHGTTATMNTAYSADSQRHRVA